MKKNDKSELDKKTNDLNKGHRKRMREKFLKQNADGFHDYELLELLLFHSIPRKDVRILAKELMNEFGTFGQLLSASEDKIINFPGLNSNFYCQIKMIKEIFSRLASEKIAKKNIIGSWAGLIDYLKLNMGNLKTEQFRVLFLNKKNILIADEIMSTGTIDSTAVYPREIIKRVLHNEASSVILVHNHPSGNCKPSVADLQLTDEIILACQGINVNVHDHVIIGHSDYYSFKSNGHLCLT